MIITLLNTRRIMLIDKKELDYFVNTFGLPDLWNALHEDYGLSNVVELYYEEFYYQIDNNHASIVIYNPHRHFPIRMDCDYLQWARVECSRNDLYIIKQNLWI